jgi:hypothetical protein
VITLVAAAFAARRKPIIDELPLPAPAEVATVAA